MVQLHRRFTDEQVQVLLGGYCQGVLTRAEIQEILGIGKTRFFALLKEYRQDSEAFSIAYERETPGRLSADVEARIKQELLREKEIVEDKRLPISGYNYSALRDRLKKEGTKVSVTTIIDRAKRLGCYKPRKKRKVHDREVLTASIGALIQHDSSPHLWSPFAQEKWVLVTSIDDFSRMLLFADFFPKDTTWAHIQAVQTLMQSYAKEIPSIRFRRAKKGGNSLFRPFALPKPYTSPKDVFCLRETRVVNGHRRISLFNHYRSPQSGALRTGRDPHDSRYREASHADSHLVE